jgi:uncharacterized membrane protein YphA (DoxX/SURF4 family)
MPSDSLSTFVPAAAPRYIAERAAPATWSVGQRLGFRFLFTYAVLYSLQGSMIPSLPGAWELASLYRSGVTALTGWVDRTFIGTGVDVWAPDNGSGDRTTDYLIILALAMVGALVTAVWTAVDRRSRAYPRLADGLQICLRYMLFFTMLSYGMSKVFLGQFPFPSPARLAQPIGATSPMGLLWTFVGSSPAYSIFNGAAELLGGVLLLWRRTATLGALVLVGVLTNVVVLNLCYDVPVKQFSIHLLAFTLVVLAPDARRLANVLLLNRPTTPRPPRRPWRWRWLERARPFAPGLLLLWLLFPFALRALSGPEAPTDTAAFAASFEVESFEVDGAERPPLATDPLRWRALHAHRRGVVVIEMMNGTRSRLQMAIDTGAHQLVLTPLAKDGTPDYRMSYRWIDPQHLALEGTAGSARLKVALAARRTDDHLLVSRGFHWINEEPFMR